MNRRQFLKTVTAAALSLGSGTIPLRAEESTPGSKLLSEMPIIDAHAHPAMILKAEPASLSVRAQAIRNMRQLGTVTSSFSAVGDVPKGADFYDRIPATYERVIEELDRAEKVIEFTGARIVRKTSDIPKLSDPGNKIGGFFALEGADVLEADPGKIDDLYQYGVRAIGLVHYRINAFGDIMTAPPRHKGLTNEGKKLIGKMQELGIAVDVAHAHIDTLRDIVAISGKPLIDSHTSLTYTAESLGTRSRSWKEMEMVAKTGGVVCTWPLAIRRRSLQRETFLDWAKEALAMSKRLGIEHIGLGTDTGGFFKATRMIEGYKDIRDITKLADAMLQVGLTKEDIAAFMAGNVLRVLKECIG